MKSGEGGVAPGREAPEVLLREGFKPLRFQRHSVIAGRQSRDRDLAIVVRDGGPLHTGLFVRNFNRSVAAGIALTSAATLSLRVASVTCAIAVSENMCKATAKVKICFMGISSNSSNLIGRCCLRLKTPLNHSARRQGDKHSLFERIVILRAREAKSSRSGSLR